MFSVIDSYLFNNYEEVDCFSFYRDVFPVGSFENKGEYVDGCYNGIAISVGLEDNHIKRYTLTDDLEVLDELSESNDFCLMSPISYAGKSRKSSNARFLYAMAIDLDGVSEDKNIKFLLEQCEHGHEMLSFVWGLPKPTYLISSGTGIHIYYVFKRPIALFPNVVKELEKLKRRLTWQAWTQGASKLHDSVQYESLFQGFRMVGTITKVGTRVKAFKVGNKVDIEYLNKFVPEEYKALNFAYKSDLSLEKAKNMYPDWYDRRIIKKQPKNSWVCSRALYDWWKKKIYESAEEGHRYWCIMTLATYAVKCGISFNELEADAFSFIPLLNSRGREPFTEDDVLHALEAFNDNYITYPIDTISQRTGIPISKNKRNGRSQDQHVKIMSAIRDIEYPEGTWREGNGRPSKKEIVKEWRKNNPEGKKIDCEKETKLSRHTVLKWWEQI